MADTEGWASGVVLASGLHHRGWREATVVQPTRLGRAFGDYFRQEILEAQNAAMRDFLVDTSILEELTPAACLPLPGARTAAPCWRRPRTQACSWRLSMRSGAPSAPIRCSA